MIVVSDTSPISNLIQINCLNLLEEVFQTIIIPDYVDEEIRRLGSFGIDLDSYLSASWIQIQSPLNVPLVEDLVHQVDQGEAEAIALALELEADYLLIDERLGNQVAQIKGLHTIGLLGVLVQGKSIGVIDLIAPILDSLQNEAGFWIGRALRERVLGEVGE